MTDAYRAAKAMTPFTVDANSRTRQHTALLAYMRELTTRMPGLHELRRYRDHDFDISVLTISEPMPTDGDRNTHAPTKAHEDLATVLALTVQGDAAVIVQDADDPTNGVAIIAKLIKVYRQSDGGGTVYLLQLKNISFLKEGDVTVFASRFKTTCNDYRNTTGAPIPNGIQRTSLLDAFRTRDVHGPGGVTLAARAPVALASLQHAFMSQKLNLDEMLGMIEVTCESILSTDPTALSPDTNSSALALVNFEHSVCATCKGTGSSPRHTNNQRDEQHKPDWSQYNDRNI